MRASEFIVEGRPQTHDQDVIDLVKLAWDEGLTVPEIVTDLGLPKNTVNDILQRYYPTRQKRVLHLAKALTDKERADIASKFLNGENAADLARMYGISPRGADLNIKNIIGVDRYNDELAKRRSAAGIRVNNKVTPEILAKIKELYIAGKTLNDISIHLDNLIEPGTVRRVMLRQPDYAEIRAQRDERLRKIKHSPVATTKITRAGEIGTPSHKGPGGRHAYGMFPTSKWGMYKP